MRRIFQVFAVVSGMLMSLGMGSAHATHLRAADIIVERVCGTLTFRITVVAYLNSASATPFGHGSLTFGDGLAYNNGPTPTELRPDLGTNVSVASFTIEHTYLTAGIYMIAYVEGDRNAGVLNIANSHDVAYMTAVTIDTNPAYGCNRFPVLTVVPLDQGCSGVAFLHSPGAFDPDGDSLSYELTIPSRAPGILADYVDPHTARFYDNFDQGNEAQTGPPIFTINDTTGLVTWDAPGAIGEYTIAFKIIEWRKDPISGIYTQISTTIRDMQIIITECDNIKPEVFVPQDLCVIAGEVVSGLITGNDPDGHNVKIELFSELLELAEDQSPATYHPDTSVFLPSNPSPQVLFNWNTKCAHVRQQPYQVVVKITDKPQEGPKLVSFKTWTIRVIAPAPVFEDVTLNVVKNYGVLSWQPVICEATKVQVWRKVGSYLYEPGKCVVGIPRNGLYHLIGEVSGTETSFIDTNNGMGLSPGAMYCYRLVALVHDTKSIASDEMCIGPIKIDAPVITHVSVEKTSTLGKIRVSWRSPMDINRTQFPEPYEYELYRAKYFVGEDSITKIGYTRDTTFVDSLINVKDHPFNYRIVLYSKPEFSESFIPIDTSFAASSERLTAIPLLNKIELHWQDSVPWSNIVQERPYHLIYRGNGILDDDELELIDSVNVGENDFTYLDSGQYNGMAIESNQIYTYRILTRGTYGNPRISLQENFSQTISTYPQNDLLPCQPIAAVMITDCDTYVNTNTCTQTSFNNIINWTANFQDTCRVDITGYKIYASESEDGEYTLLATVDQKNGLSYTELDLATPARCYRVSAIDVTGQEGPPSDPVCNDSCPYFELPNVFTPNGDGCNDLFTARFNLEGGEGICNPLNILSCPRFVRAVSLTVLNRWGKEVYYYSSENNENIYVDWNGKDNTGTDMATGVYYYVAEIDFYALDPGKQRKAIKGWVHLIR